MCFTIFLVSSNYQIIICARARVSLCPSWRRLSIFFALSDPVRVLSPGSVMNKICLNQHKMAIMLTRYFLGVIIYISSNSSLNNIQR